MIKKATEAVAAVHSLKFNPRIAHLHLRQTRKNPHKQKSELAHTSVRQAVFVYFMERNAEQHSN